MKNLHAILCCVALLSAMSGLAAQTPDWLWAKRMGGTGEDYVYSATSDSFGNTYLTGSFRNTVTFGANSLTSSGEDDIFVAKLDHAGNWLWAARAGGTSYDFSLSIAVDSFSNVYVSGYFFGTAFFGGDSLTSYASYNNDLFVAKLDYSGNWLWATKAGGNGDDRGLGITADGAGNVYVTGRIQTTPSFGSIPLVSHGGNDIFVAKLDIDGDWLWATSAGGNGYEEGYDIAVNDVGDIYMTGYFGAFDDGNTSFGSTTLISDGHYDICVAKLDTDGNWVWARRAGGVDADLSRDIAVDDASNVYIAGGFTGSADFGSFSLTSSGNYDICVAKLDSTGTWLWASRGGGTGSDESYGIAVDETGNVYQTGCFSGSATFGSTSLSASGYTDVVVTKLNSNGSWLWAKSAGNTSYDYGMGIGLDNSANVYLAGLFTGYADFGPITLTGLGGIDFFVAKLGEEVGASDDLTPPLTANILSAWPNPFTQSTTLSIALDKLNISMGISAQNLRVSLYDLKGRKVRTLAFDPACGDELTLTWDGRDANGVPCNSGIYFARLKAQGKNLCTAKLSLVK